jgi:hypothetical protein
MIILNLLGGRIILSRFPRFSIEKALHRPCSDENPYDDRGWKGKDTLETGTGPANMLPA